MATLDALRMWLGDHEVPVQPTIVLNVADLATAMKSMFGSADGDELRVVDRIQPRP